MEFLNYDVSFLNDSNRNIFCDMLSYTSELIIKYDFSEDYVKVYFEKEEYKDEIISKIDFLKEIINSKSIGNGKEKKTKILYDRRDVDTINKNELFKKLIELGDIKEITDGVYGYGGLLLKVLKYFENKIESFAKEKFSTIEELRFPCLFSIEEFEKGGYFETFPHHVMFQTVIKNDVEILDQFAKKGTEDKSVFDNMKAPNNILRTATCVPIYPMLKDRIINKEESPLLYFANSRCFRNEGSNVFELARLKEFSMAEVVVVGSDEEIRDNINLVRELWDFWIEKFDLNCMIETANDSFFASNYQKLKFFQLIGDSKQEFKLLLPHCENYISCSSINFHRTHFTKPYNIKRGEDFSFSGCIAFGIERLAYALICQKGYDVKKWDEKTFEEVSKFVEL